MSKPRGFGAWLCRRGLHFWDTWVEFHPTGRWATRRGCIRRGCGKAEWL